MTSVLQPCDYGIIKSFKSHYQALILTKVESKLKEKNYAKISIKRYELSGKKNWENFPETAIKNCCAKTNVTNTQNMNIGNLEFDV